MAKSNRAWALLTSAYTRATRPDDDTTYIVAVDRMKAILGKKAQAVGEPFAGRLPLAVRDVMDLLPRGLR